MALAKARSARIAELTELAERLWDRRTPSGNYFPPTLDYEHQTFRYAPEPIVAFTVDGIPIAFVIREHVYACFKVCPRDAYELVERELSDDDDEDDSTVKVMRISNRLDCIGCQACAKVCPKACHTHEPALA